MKFKNFIIAFETPILFAYLGFKFQKHVDEVLKSRATKELHSGSRIDWVFLLEKHKENILFVNALFGANSIVFFEDQIYQSLLDAAPSTLYS